VEQYFVEESFVEESFVEQYFAEESFVEQYFAEESFAEESHIHFVWFIVFRVLEQTKRKIWYQLLN